MILVKVVFNYFGHFDVVFYTGNIKEDLIESECFQ